VGLQQQAIAGQIDYQQQAYPLPMFEEVDRPLELAGPGVIGDFARASRR